jgi:vitamin B12 transporter
MNKKYLFIAFLSLLGFNLFSQENTTTEETPIEEVTVTANRFSQKINETAKNVTVISKEELERSKGLSVAQILQNQVGMTIVGANNNPGSPISVFTRGASSGKTLILLNGMPINDPSSIEMNFDLNLISSEQLTRIEIVKNAQSTLYGSDAIAGVINLITKPETGDKRFSPSLSLQGGSFGTIKAAAGINAGDEKMYAQILLNYNKTSGISDATKDLALSNNTPYETDKSRFLGAMINAGGKSNNLSYRVNGALGTMDGGVDDGAFRDEKDYTYLNQFSSFGGGLDFSGKKFKITANVKSDFNNRFYENDSTWVAADAFGKYSSNKYIANTVFAELFSTIKINENIGLLVGTDVRKQRTSQEDNYDNFISKLGRDSANSLINSVYAMLYLKTKIGFFTEVGGRFNVHSLYGNNATFNFSPSYNVNEKFRFFANVATGFKTPSLYQLFSPYGNKKLKPEESISSEIGLQYKTEKSNTKIAFFQRNIKNGIFFLFDPVTFAAQYINQDKQNDYGVELEQSYKIGKFDFSANYTFVTGEITTKNGARDTTYNNLARRAKHTINFNIGYNLTEEIFLKLNARSVGKRYDLFYNSSTFKVDKIELPAYVLLDFYGEYTFSKKYKAFLQLNNILNQQYYDIYGFNTRPVNFMLGVSAKF